MKTIAQKINLLALTFTVALATSGCSLDSFRSPSADYIKPGELSQDVDSLPDPNAQNPDRVSIAGLDSMRRTESPERLLMQANEYFEQKRYHDSARLYKKYLMTPAASTASPDILATAHYRIGYVASKKTQYQEACQEYRQALQIAPFNNEYLFAYGRACYDSGDFATAEAQFVQLASRAPNYPELQYYYGLTLLESTDRARALQPLTAAKGNLEAYFLLADKYYAKGELQPAVQTEAQMLQIAAQLGINAPELPHKSKSVQPFPNASVVATAPVNTTLQNVGTVGVQVAPGNTAALPNVSNQIAGTQPSAAPIATPSVPNPGAVPQTAMVGAPQIVAQTTVPAATPQTPASVQNPALAANVGATQVPNGQAFAPQVANPTPNGLPNPNASNLASTVQVVPPSVQVQAPQNVAPKQIPANEQLAQVQTVPNPGTPAPVVQNVAPNQIPANTQLAQVQTVPNTGTPAPVAQNVAPNQIPANAQLAQVQTIPTQATPTANPALVPQTSYAPNNDAGLASNAPVPGQIADVPNGAPVFAQSEPTQAPTSEAYADLTEEASDDDEWDDFAFACSGQPNEPTPTASLIASEEAPSIQAPEVPSTVGEGFSEYQGPGLNVSANPLEDAQNEAFSQADQILNEKSGELSVAETAPSLAQTVVPTVPAPASPQTLESAPTTPSALAETEIGTTSLASSELPDSNDVESAPSQISNEPSFIDFRPGSTMRASLVTVLDVDENKTLAEPAPPVETVELSAEPPKETFVSDYNVPQFPSEPSYEQEVEDLAAIEPIQRVYTIKDMERLASDWALFELNLITYLPPTPMASAPEQAFVQAPVVVPQAIPQAIPPQGYSSPEEFFRSTPPANAPVVQQTVVQQTPTPNMVASETRLGDQISEISISRSSARNNSTPEERLEAARAAGAEVVELTPEQYRQAVTFGTTRR